MPFIVTNTVTVVLVSFHLNLILKEKIQTMKCITELVVSLGKLNTVSVFRKLYHNYSEICKKTNVSAINMVLDIPGILNIFFKVGLLLFVFCYQAYANIIASPFRGYFLQQVFAIQNDSGKASKI